MDGNRNLWHGYWFDGAHEVWLSGFGACGDGDGIIVNGIDGASNVDLYLSQGYSNFNSGVGIRSGGGFGGLFIGEGVEILGNNYAGLSVDNTINTQTNREIIISAGVVFDGIQTNTLYDIILDSPNSSSAQVTIAAFLGSAKEVGVYIKSMPYSTVVFQGPEIFNNLGDGVRVDDPTVLLSISDSTVIQHNGGYGVNATVPMNTEIHGTPFMRANASGDWSDNTYRGPAALSLASGWSGTAKISKKMKRNIINGYISQSAGTIPQYATIATIPEGYRPSSLSFIVLVYSGGLSGDGMVPGRINLDGTIQVLQEVDNAVNIAFSGSWDTD